AAVLPDDGAVNGPSGGAVPDDDGLALVGDPDGGDLGGPPVGGGQRLADGAGDGVPDVLGLVLDPAVAGVVLFDLLLGGPEDGERVGVVGDRPGAGGALVDGQDHGGRHDEPRRGKEGARRCGTWYHGGSPGPHLHQPASHFLFLFAARRGLLGV